MNKTHHSLSASHSPRVRKCRRIFARSFMLASLFVLSVIALIAGPTIPIEISATRADQNDELTSQATSSIASQQIQALEDEKESRTPAQQKIDSQLLYALKMERVQPIASALQSLQVDVGQNEQGRVVVDISGTIDDKLLQVLANAGATIVVSTPEYNSIRVEVGLDRLEDIALSGNVRFIQPKQDYTLDKASGTTTPVDNVRSSTDFHARTQRVRAQLATALSAIRSKDAGLQPGLMTTLGTFHSEGDVTHRANTARGTFNTDGSGVKIGVLSNGVVSVAQAQALGELGPVTILPGQVGTGDEGTAMLEIIHDLAPGAQLYFATAVEGIGSFARNIRDLRAAGCDIIVDDVWYGAETPFHDGQAPPIISNTNGGVILQAVNDVTAAGALYFSSAGNAGNKDIGTSSIFQGDFIDGGPNALMPGGTVNNFGGGTLFDTISSPGGAIGLYWADPLGASANDYDLFVLNSAGTAVIAASTNVQNGTQDPLEQIGSAGANVTGNRIVVLKKTAAAARFFHLTINANTTGRLAISTEGATRGHSVAANAYAVAATPAIPNTADFFGPGSPAGPFPGVFNSTNVTERYSSDGPRRIFFNPDGTAITPGNLSSTGGLVRQKPDITAADGVITSGVGFVPQGPGYFFGTSAAAPHAAAIAGLIKAANPALTSTQIRTALTSSAVDIQAPGVDRDSGAGIVMAYQALQAAGATGAANLQIGTITVTEVGGGNGNGFIEPGEQGTATIQLLNTGVNAATGISATLVSNTPGVFVTPPGTSAYPDIPATTGTGNNATSFAFAVSSTAACPANANFTLTVTYAGGPSPFAIPVSIAISQTVTINETLDNTTPPISRPPLFTAATGTQRGRLVRTGFTTECEEIKPNPGLNDSIPNRRFDSYAFSNPTNSPICIGVTFNTGGGNPGALYSAAYSVFDPSEPQANFLGDYGFSKASLHYSFNAPANSNFTIVVHEITAGSVGATPVPYSLQITGVPCAAAASVNQPPVNTVPGAQTMIENGQLVFSTANGNAISVSDPDAGANPVQVTLASTNGALSLGGTSGLSFTVGTGTSNATMTFTGSITAINTALQGLTYRPNANFTGTAALSLTTDDQGFLGSGGSRTANSSVPIAVSFGSTFQFDAANYLVGESDGSTFITILRNGDLSTAASIDYATTNGTASDRSDYEAAFGTVHFVPGQFSAAFPVLINEDSLLEGSEVFNLTVSNPQGANVALGLQSTSVVTIVDNSTEPSTNVIDDTAGFVRQHYHDFLNREPDPPGLSFWINNIESCGANASCREAKRIDTSAAFFLSIEFLQTRYLVERIYKTSYGDATGSSTLGGSHTFAVPIVRLNEFLSDSQEISQGVIVGQSGWEQQLENNKQAFTTEFARRSRFTTAFPITMTPAQFVDQLFINAGVTPSATDRAAAINEFGSATNTTDVGARGRALRRVAENATLTANEFNRAFVLIQYFGYLRRNPNNPQDTDYTGYDFWLTKLNQFGGNHINAEMVKAFISSVEYRQRFGP